MNRKVVSLITIFFSVALNANPIEVVGTQTVDLNSKSEHDKPMMLQSANGKVSQASTESEKKIELLKFKLSNEAKQAIKQRIDKVSIMPEKYSAVALPTSVQLEMENVPVLDQGRHGSCVTFAVTGALDAAIQKGNYVSQLCNLTLGNYLEHHYGQPSGWNGSWGHMVLHQIDQYGYINQDDQHKYLCGGLKDYPTNSASQTGGETSPQEFAKHSLLLSEGIYWDRIHSLSQTMDANFETDTALNEVKTALASGHRVVFGTLIDTQVGQVGATGRHKSWVNYDTWKMTPEIEKHLRAGQINAGHEMIIIGYDDKAKVDGQKGVLTIRNSWGRGAGNGGTYYMTYDYFKAMVNETYRIYSRHDKPHYLSN